MLVLIRGIPGSGKSTFAKYLQTDVYLNRAIHLEADMYFTDYDGSYHWDVKKIKEAHSWCQNTAEIMMNQHINVIVSNTFTKIWEMQSYINYARMIGIEYIVYRMTSNYGSIHNVPEDVIDRMKISFEDYPGEIMR